MIRWTSCIVLSWGCTRRSPARSVESKAAARADMFVRGREVGMKMRGKWWSAAAVSRALLWLLLPNLVMAMQLPPDVQADRYLLQAERAIQD